MKISELFHLLLPSKKQKNLFFFTDCADSNAASRVTAHLTARLPNYNSYVYGINSWQEASINLLNIVEVWEKTGSTGNIVVGNIAPRTDKSWQNGAPFCFVWVNGNLVIGTPACFAMLLREKSIPGNIIYQTDVQEVCSKLIEDQAEVEEISRTQFRSLWYVPRLAAWLVSFKKVPWKILDLKHVPAIEEEILLIDCFGNIKLSIDSSRLGDVLKGKTKFLVGQREYDIPASYGRLSDIPNGQVGFIVGSGGGLIELIVNGGSAAKHFDARIGEKIEFVVENRASQ